MKNNIVSTVLICTSMFLLTNCFEKNVHDKVNISIPEKTKLKNPVIPSSAAEFQNRFNIKFNLPENSEQIEYSIIAEKLIQMNFVWSCCDCTVRSKKSNKFEDISGCYYDWESTSIEKIKNVKQPLNTQPAQTVTSLQSACGLIMKTNRCIPFLSYCRA